jgi:hypothetical protein
MNDPVDPLPEASRLPDDAKHLGLMPITAPELQVAAALRRDKPLHKALAWIALLLILGGIVWSIVRAFVG